MSPDNTLWFFPYVCLFSGMYLGGSRARGETRPYGLPFVILGAIGVCVVAFAQTYAGTWQYADLGDYFSFLTPSDPASFGSLLPVAGLPIAAVASLGAALRRRSGPVRVLFGAAPAMTVAALVLAAVVNPIGPQLLANIYLLGLGLAALISGMRRGHRGLANLGVTILGVLIVFRFFDGEISFLVRGLAFIAVGLGFLTTNLVLARSKKGGAVQA
ncbi:MAG: hypothetical protein ACM3ZC_11305 [Bacteroidota bacterium]